MLPNTLRQRLEECPAGRDGWQEFENICIDILHFLFVPPLQPPKIQTRTIDNTQRMGLLKIRTRRQNDLI